MTLHEAIEQVLIEKKRKLTAKELAYIINDRQLYKRQDNFPVTASQITSRISNYESLFIFKGGLISLKGFNQVDLYEAEIQQDLLVLLENARILSAGANKVKLFSFILSAVINIDKNNGSTGTLAEFMDTVVAESGFGKYDDLFQEDFFEAFIKVAFSIQRYPNRNRILQKLAYWLNPFQNSSGLYILPEYLCSIIGGLDIYSEKLILRTNQNMLNNYKLNIFENNLNAAYLHSFAMQWANDDIVKQNNLLLEAATGSFESFKDDNQPTRAVGIFTPPWGVFNKDSEWSSNFVFIMNELEGREKILLNKAVLIVPEGANYSGGKDLNARKYLTERNYIDSVVTLPFSSPGIAIKSISIIVFDFNKKSEEVLFADFNQMENFDIEQNWNQIVTVINDKQNLHQVSKKVNYQELQYSEYSWAPTRYIFDAQSLPLKENHEAVLLDSLLLQIKKGFNIDRKKLYEGGEIKYLKTSDLSQNDIYLQLNENILGIDADEFEKPIEAYRDSIVVSFVGSQLKPTLVPENELIVFNHNLAILQLNTALVLPEFLALELKEDYIETQLLEKRTGTTIPFLTIKGFCSLFVQIPSLAIQKDILLQRNRQRNSEAHPVNNQNADLSKVILHSYLGIIKHTMKQPLATLSSDIKSIGNYLRKKEEENKLNLQEFVVDLLPGEKESENDQSRVVKTLERLTRAIEDAHWRFEQSEMLLKIETSEINLKKEDVKQEIGEQIKNYTDIKFALKGKSQSVFLDKHLWAILIDNLIDNARKHGFVGQSNPKVLFEFSTQKTIDDTEVLIISYFNNGTPLPSNFNIDKFISNGVSTNKEAGDGFGGYLINNILKKHNGRIEVIPSKELLQNEYNVCFKIYLNAI
ncbi:HTH domain-containing protein [Fluviicola taffensis]|uniref:N-6 DNA methylase n=1 Tax=Fluviicola taffensis (strain DSM 16823 / NCIMB 13979 / RW262) TaxID=755732 RepID=F2IGS0_FLUTR|nr:HTH domain-containing protein [Fluviicola taffensis]AEA43687.1 N-6 DNA methylase [Fluviicola taffensis DSM 16823]